ncbi:PAS domain-containing protein [Streptomyces daqingensis]|uniref:PAS domain-containing protein n=1 Tax=Streptomyces daqingensis TaxID=1472640 RepID=UPI0016672117|nr:PAS domain-containing protein [Streptomyces daqingensis]
MSSRPSRGAARLAAILDALPDALLLVNCNGTVVNANTIALEAFETPGTALVGRGLLDLLPEFDSKRIPGSMRRPDEAAAELQERQRPTRMVARRTDGTEFPVEVTSANLEDGRTPYASAFEAAFADHGPGSGNSYTGDELLMLVVRDLTGTLDTEAELARQQRQTEMILRAASEGVVGVDTEGRIVLVNPAAAQILGYRAGDLGGKELHPLVLHSRPDGNPLPYEETTLHDTLRSGRKHRVRAGQVMWAKNGQAVPVDITTAPVRDGEQLVGAVVTFSDRRAVESLAGRHDQLLAVLQESLRKPLDQLRDELTGLAADPAGQLWPEANQILHHLAAGYARMTTLVDNVLAYQRLDAGQEKLHRETISLDGVVANGVEGAVELIGPGRAQFAVHAPPIEAEVDGGQLATALAHLIADVAGVDATGNAPAATAGMDSTIVVAAAQRGDVVRIEVRGPYSGGNPVHEPIVRGIVRRHGGVLQTHEVPGSGGNAYVLEVPVSAESGTGQDAAAGSGEGSTNGAGSRSREGRENETTVMPVPAQPVRGSEGATAGAQAPAAGAWTGTGDVSGSAPAAGIPSQFQAQQAQEESQGQNGQPPTGRRRGRPSPAEAAQQEQPQGDTGPEAGAVPAQQGGAARPRRALAAPAGGATDGAGVQPVPAEGQPLQPGAQVAQPEAQAQPGTGRRARRPVQVPPGQQPDAAPAQAGAEAADGGAKPAGSGGTSGGRRARRLARAQAQGRGQAGAEAGAQGQDVAVVQNGQQPAQTEGEAAPQGVQFAAPPGQPQPGYAQSADQGQTPPPAPNAQVPDPAGANGAAPNAAAGANGAAPAAANGMQQPQPVQEEQAPEPEPEPEPQPMDLSVVAASPILGGGPLPPEPPQPQGPPMPGAAGFPDGGQSPYETGHHQVRTLGQGVPFTYGGGDHTGAYSFGPTGPAPTATSAPPTAIPTTPSTPGSGRRRKLAAPPQPGAPQQGAPQQPGASPPNAPQPGAPQPNAPQPGGQPGAQQPAGRPAAQGRAGMQAQAAPAAPPPAREFTIEAPAAGAAEGPEPLDGPNSPVEMSDGRGVPVPPQPADDELPPEPLDNPRRLLVWPEPDPSTQQALSGRGYRPVLVHSREEVDAQISSYPAALFVDPLTGPITRTALQSLRTAAVAAEVPVLVTAGLGQATREAAYGADPAVLLKALAPRDSEQHPPRVMLIEERPAVAGALASSLERRGIQVAHASTDTDAVGIAGQVRPNLVVTDLMQVHQRRAGLIDWLRSNGLLSRTPFVVYTSAGMHPAELPRLATGETVLFLAERATSDQVQTRIVDLLSQIGTR